MFDATKSFSYVTTRNYTVFSYTYRLLHVSKVSQENEFLDIKINYEVLDKNANNKGLSSITH